MQLKMCAETGTEMPNGNSTSHPYIVHKPINFFILFNQFPVYATNAFNLFPIYATNADSLSCKSTKNPGIKVKLK